MTKFDPIGEEENADPLDIVCHFGKYQGATYRQIADQDCDYAWWLAVTATIEERIKEALSEYLQYNYPPT